MPEVLMTFAQRGISLAMSCPKACGVVGVASALATRLLTAESRARAKLLVPQAIGASAVYFLLDRLGSLGG